MAANGPIRYYPPEGEELDDFAQRVCEHLAQSDPAFLTRDVWRGLAEHLKVAARIYAKHLSSDKSEKLDSNSG